MSDDTPDTLREPPTRRGGPRTRAGRDAAGPASESAAWRAERHSQETDAGSERAGEPALVASDSDRSAAEPSRTSSPAPLLSRLPVSSSVTLDERQEMIRIISNRLFLALTVLTSVLMTGAALMFSGRTISGGATVWLVLLCGFVGGFIGLQRRLKTLEREDLMLLARSWVYVVLSPLVGGILALLMLILFVSGLLDGDLFPNFLGAERSVTEGAGNDLSSLTRVYGAEYKDYAKLVFWCFIAGYSERFVTNIVSHFEATADSATSSR